MTEIGIKSTLYYLAVGVSLVELLTFSGPYSNLKYLYYNNLNY